MLMQNFGVTNKEHYGMLWYFWSGRFQDSQKHQVIFFIRLTQKNHTSPYPVWQPSKIKIDIKLFGLKRIVLRTPFFSVFKLKKG